MSIEIYQMILQYKMTKEEKLAMLVAGIYLDQAFKYYPEYHHLDFPKKGDPRKCELFRYCWKLVNETKKKLHPTDYHNYIKAQLSVLKNLTVENNSLFYSHRCLVGEPAWGRWILWKKYFEASKQTSEVKATPIELTKEIEQALREAHYVLKVRLGEITKDKVLEEMPNILRWVKMNVISPIWVACSPTAQEYIKKYKPKLGFEIPKVEAGQLYTDIFNDN